MFDLSPLLVRLKWPWLFMGIPMTIAVLTPAVLIILKQINFTFIYSTGELEHVGVAMITILIVSVLGNYSLRFHKDATHMRSAWSSNLLVIVTLISVVSVVYTVQLASFSLAVATILVCAALLLTAIITALLLGVSPREDEAQRDQQ